MRPRVVYLVLTHQFPALIHRLVRILLEESANAFVVVHHDATHCLLPALPEQQVHVLGDPVRTARGDMTFVTATLRGIEWIRAHLDYDWIVHISGQDYPLVHLGQVDAALATSPYDAYLRFQPLEQAAAMCAERYLRRWYSLKVPFRRRKRIIFSRPYNVVFTDRFRCYKGSQWWTLSRPAIDTMMDFLARTPRYWKQYERSFIPIESFLPTIVLNTVLKVFPHHMRYLVWGAAENRHPEVLTMRDLPAMLASGDWFARKFNPDVSAEVLDRLDDRRRATVATPAD